jgi:hypothetical protein
MAKTAKELYEMYIGGLYSIPCPGSDWTIATWDELQSYERLLWTRLLDRLNQDAATANAQ